MNQSQGVELLIDLGYFQVIKLQRIVKVSDKNDSSNVYKIPIGILKESPLENEVRNVLAENKMFAIPKDELQLEKYPLQDNVTSVIRKPNDKTFVVEKKYLIEFREESENNIIEEKDDERKCSLQN